MTNNISLATNLSDIPGVGPQRAEQLEKIGAVTVSDLFEILPYRFEDRSALTEIKKLTPGIDNVIAGTITRIGSRLSKKGAFIVQAVIEDQSGKITAVWFNQRYLLKTLQEGDRVLLYGTKKVVPSMSNPFFVKKSIPRLEVAPIYPSTADLPQFFIPKLLRQLRPILSTMKDVIPPKMLGSLGLASRRIAIDQAHFSTDEKTIETARQLLGFEELFILCLEALWAKKTRIQEEIEPTRVAENELEKAKSALNFELTNGQEKALKEIAHDLERPYPMNRLLHGEVGSGKTALAILSAVSIIKSGRRTIWLSPTTTLAIQQAKLMETLAPKLGITSSLYTGRNKQSVDANLIVGTHAVLHNVDGFKDVGLIIIDEQHRFGVGQRNQLVGHHPKAHLLMMSATPIPRSLSHTLFGHLDITFLEGKPEHQKPVSTVIFTDTSRSKVEEHIRERLSRQQPGYVICPLITSATQQTDKLFNDERKTIHEEERYLRSTFPEARIGVLHGKLKGDDREKVMADFVNNQIDILLATSVVEVGIDNQNATWILIEEADYFGLSQLHQLRGRVGRGDKPSVCFLHNSLTTEQATERLKVITENTEGLKIAEADLAFRGPGSLAGIEQSGLAGLRYADITNLDIIKKAYAAANEITSEGLDNYPLLASKIKKHLNVIQAV